MSTADHTTLLRSLCLAAMLSPGLRAETARHLLETFRGRNYPPHLAVVCLDKGPRQRLDGTLDRTGPPQALEIKSLSDFPNLAQREQQELLWLSRDFVCRHADTRGFDAAKRKKWHAFEIIYCRQWLAWYEAHRKAKDWIDAGDFNDEFRTQRCRDLIKYLGDALLVTGQFGECCDHFATYGSSAPREDWLEVWRTALCAERFGELSDENIDSAIRTAKDANGARVVDEVALERWRAYHTALQGFIEAAGRTQDVKLARDSRMIGDRLSVATRALAEGNMPKAPAPVRSGT